jgi:hypothetical protein
MTTLEHDKYNNYLPKIISSLDSIICTKDEEMTANENENDSIKILPSCSIPSKSASLCPNRHLVLHFDINETILVGDDAGGDTVEDCLNKIIAKSAFVQISTHYEPGTPTRDVIPTHWWDGTPIILTSKEEGEEEQKLQQQQQQQQTQPASSTIAPPSPPISLPPPLYTGWEWPKNTCPYYRSANKNKAKTFTQPNGDGSCYRPLYDHLEKQLSKINCHSDSQLQSLNDDKKNKKSKSHPFCRMLPSFFHTLVKLQKDEIDYTLVLRTFGTDLDDIASALTDFANGKHPLFPNFREPKLVLGKDKMFKGRWRKSSDNIHCHDDGHDDKSKDTADSSVYDLYPWDYTENENDNIDNKFDNVVASGDDQVLQIMQQATVCGIQDDYNHWDKNNNAPWSGKPVWIDSLHQKQKVQSKPEDMKQSYHHLFFDDNIHNDANDSIVAVRAMSENNKWISLSGMQTIEEQGKYLFRVPTVQVIVDNDWFYRQILSALSRV